MDNPGIVQRMPHFGNIVPEGGPGLHYAEWGRREAGDPILFLHGYADSWYSFSRLLESLSPGRHAYALDLRGHGDSAKPECCYSEDDFAADVLNFMDVLGIEKAHLVGHSMGSLIAQKIAIDRPRRVGRLMLISSAPTAAGNPVLLEFEPTVRNLTDPIDREFVREFQTPSNPVPEEFLETIVSESMKVPAHVWRAVLAGLLATDHGAGLSRISSPTLIAWGEQDGIFPGRSRKLCFE